MKSTIGFVLVLACAIWMPVTATATVIIDGTAPGYVNDGSFEAGGVWQGPGSNLAADLGINKLLYRGNAPGIADGTRYVLVGDQARAPQDQPPASNLFGVYLDTGYDLVAGDTFDLSFSHLLHSSVDSTDSVIFQLFTTTTGDDAGLVDRIIASEEVFGVGASSFTGIGSVPGGAVGERLFVAAVRGQTSGDALTAFALDEVNLTRQAPPPPATAVPEPAALSVLGGIVLVAVRRRRLR